MQHKGLECFRRSAFLIFWVGIAAFVCLLFVILSFIHLSFSWFMWASWFVWTLTSPWRIGWCTTIYADVVKMIDRSRYMPEGNDGKTLWLWAETTPTGWICGNLDCFEALAVNNGGITPNEGNCHVIGERGQKPLVFIGNMTTNHWFSVQLP